MENNSTFEYLLEDWHCSLLMSLRNALNEVISVVWYVYEEHVEDHLGTA